MIDWKKVAADLRSDCVWSGTCDVAAELCERFARGELVERAQHARLILEVQEYLKGRSTFGRLSGALLKTPCSAAADLCERMARGELVNAPESAPTFEQMWAEMESRGYQYGEDALEQVRLGWELCERSKR